MTDFLLDAMLGKLATYLRMCGHDTVYLLDGPNADGDREMADEEGATGVGEESEVTDEEGATGVGEKNKVGGDDEGENESSAVAGAKGAFLPPEESVVERARQEGRMVLTRDADLAAVAGESLLLETHDVVDQLQELAAAGISLSLPETPTRCGSCNGQLAGVPPDTQTPEYAPDPVSVEVWQCERCGQFFWKGSHWDDVAETLGKIDRG